MEHVAVLEHDTGKAGGRRSIILKGDRESTDHDAEGREGTTARLGASRPLSGVASPRVWAGQCRGRAARVLAHGSARSSSPMDPRFRWPPLSPRFSTEPMRVPASASESRNLLSTARTRARREAAVEEAGSESRAANMSISKGVRPGSRMSSCGMTRITRRVSPCSR
eukprot:scaffold1870_cov96-Isochrysis_galbana.AAC.1